jgi:hypothetical protein
MLGEQEYLVWLWEGLYINTQSFTRNEDNDTDESTDSDEYYSDGRRICIKDRDHIIEDDWLVQDDGAAADFPHGTRYFVRTPSDHNKIPADKFSTMAESPDVRRRRRLEPAPKAPKHVPPMSDTESASLAGLRARLEMSREEFLLQKDRREVLFRQLAEVIETAYAECGGFTEEQVAELEEQLHRGEER